MLRPGPCRGRPQASMSWSSAWPWQRTAQAGNSRRAYRPLGPVPAVKIRGPTLWCLAVVAGIYLGCAACEVRGDMQTIRPYRPRARHDEAVGRDADGLQQGIDGTMLSAARDKGYASALAGRLLATEAEIRRVSRSAALPDAHTLTGRWRTLFGSEQMVVGAAGMNTAIFAACHLMPSMEIYFSHLSIGSRNFTLLSSAFGHTGVAHLAMNMYGLVNFGLPVARSTAFGFSMAHLSAFYLTAGVAASLAHHVSCNWKSFEQRVRPAMGASGAIYAMLGAFGLIYPNARIGIVLLPGSVSAQDALGLAALFETYGLLKGFKYLPFAHGAHLAGLAFGSAYIYFDGPQRVWEPSRRLAFESMRILGVV